MWGEAADGLDSWVDLDAQHHLESCLAALEDLLYDDVPPGVGKTSPTNLKKIPKP